MVIVYLLAGVVCAGVLRNISRVTEEAGVFPFGVLVDQWARAFISLLCVISGRVFVWSYYYIDGEAVYRRFLGVLTTFVASMVMLILSSSLFLSLVGWDGLGVTSFLLVIYFKNRKSLGSGIITALTNRGGDAVFLILLGVSLGHTGGWRY